MTEQTLSADVRETYLATLRANASSDIEFRSMMAAVVSGGIAYLISSTFLSSGWSAGIAFLVGAIVRSIVEGSLKHSMLEPLSSHSDQMLTLRYSELMADERTARIRSAIMWGVILIVLAGIGIAYVYSRVK
jgi:hypothetical protein